MFFDTTRIPQTATVQGASLRFTVVDTSTSTFEIFALKLSWSELTTTWNKRALATTWSLPGAEGTADRESTGFASFVPSALGTKTVNFGPAGIALVQQWVTNGASANHGFIIARPDVLNGVAIASSEVAKRAQRPHLIVSYSVGP